jgi:hypothetical protein
MKSGVTRAEGGAHMAVPCQLTADLDAPVHRARMHDQRVGLGRAQFVVVEPEEVKILACRRHEGATS